MGAFESSKAAQGSFYLSLDPAGAQGISIPFPGRKAGASSQVLMVLPQGQLHVLPDGNSQGSDSL